MNNDIEELKNFILDCLHEKKADNIETLELSDNIPLAKYMIFASGRSRKNISAVAEYIMLELKDKHKLLVNAEGRGHSDWVLIDAGDIIIHLFQPEAREEYKLKELWIEKIKINK
ncbi:MAG: ribosome silencing factor [Rickettsiaceae bacterium]|nr:ribosome silencing factor [Rickettsiaceae bacterium]